MSTGLGQDETRQSFWARPKRAAKHYDVGLTTIYKWLGDGTVKTKKMGAVRLIECVPPTKEESA